MEYTKLWIKSKQMWLNISTAITGFLGFISIEFNNNIEFIKASGIDVKYIYALIFFNAILNIYLRYTAQTKLVNKKDEVQDGNNNSN